MVNLEEAGKEGSHWVCYAYREAVPVYFDSFGVPPDDRLLKLLKSNPTGIVFVSSAQIQDIDSTNCGKYCIKFLQDYMEKEHCLHDVLMQFKPYPADSNETKIDKVKVDSPELETARAKEE